MAESEPIVAEATTPVAEAEAAAAAAAAEEEVLPPEDKAVVEETKEEENGVGDAAAEEEDPVEPLQGDQDSVAAPDHKRKLEDLKTDGGDEKDAGEQDVSARAAEMVAEPETRVDGEVKRQRLDSATDGSGHDGEREEQELQGPSVVNAHHPPTEYLQRTAEEELPKPTDEVSQEDVVSIEEQQATPGLTPVTSRRMEVPNDKVGVLIGKAGDTIKNLQINSGAKIQITRDAESDPNSSTRPVELAGSLESINKAEKLIKDVIAEADAGGSPALVAMGFGTVQSGSEQFEIQVPNEKVGLVIGKGGETIKNLQTRSGARIQLIPQHLPEGDVSKERTVRVSGNKKQVETAKEMIKEVINQLPQRSTTRSGGYNQHNFRPRGPGSAPQWGPPRPQPLGQPSTGYDYHQRGMYPSQNTQYSPQTYDGYSQQPPPRSGMNAWDQRPGGPPVQTPQSDGYDHYKQGGGQPFDAPTSGGGAPVNYNYGQSQAPGYGQSGPMYAQSGPTQQGYGAGYDQPKYDGHAPSQQYYGQQPMGSQQGYQSGGYSGYPQQQDPYGSKPAYGGVQQPYGPPRPAQPGDAMYQGQAPPQSYGPGVPTQQPYPYGAAPSQQAPAYGQTYGPASGVAADGYPQPGAGGYGQPGPTYAQQGAQPGGYGQYPPAQQGYGDQSVPSSGGYGYQGGPAADASYGSGMQNSGYGAAPGNNQAAGYGQAGYMQPPQVNASGGYDQSAPTTQTGYGGGPASTPVGYAKGPSPQPGYGTAPQW